MKTRSYGGFTLIEMVVVMGILILLMAIGIGAGRAALNNAADTAHQASVKQIYEAAMAYYSVKGAFPAIGTTCTATVSNSFACLLGTSGALGSYIESFDGGNDATYYYITDVNKQYLVVCATIGGQEGGAPRGAVCEGNGFGVVKPNNNDLITKKKMTSAATETEYTALTGCTTPNCFEQSYTSKTWGGALSVK